MFNPGLGAKRWKKDELVTELSRYLGRSDDPIKFCNDTWTPIGIPHSSDYHRSVLMFDAEPLGMGTFGIVFATAISLPLLEGESKDDLRFVPAAMKFSISAHDHCSDLVAGLTLNELVSAGATPNVTRVIDGFSVSGAKLHCCHPSPTWKRFWSAVAKFLSVNGNLQRVSAMYGGAPSDVNACLELLRKHGTFSYLFTELAPDEMKAPSTQSAYAQHVTKPRGSPNFLHESIAVRPPKHERPRRLLVDVWQRIHAVSAIHAINILHGDLHSFNFVTHKSAEFRTPFCRLSDARSDKVASSYFGAPGVERPSDHFEDPNHDQKGWRFYAVPTKPYQSSSDTFNVPCVALSPEDPIVTLIDLGKVFRMNAPAGTSEVAIQKWILHTGPLPPHIVSKNPLKYDPHRYFRDIGLPMCPNATPGMSITTRPSTSLYTRAPELLNVPQMTRPPTHLIYSELSDVFSLAMSIVSEIIGFYPFGNYLLVNTESNEESLGFFVSEVRTRDDVFYRAKNHGVIDTGRLNTSARYKTRPPESFKRAMVAGDKWVEMDRSKASKASAMTDYLQRITDLDQAKYIERWLGKDADLFSSSLSMVLRVFALGAPSRDRRLQTIYEHPMHNSGLVDTSKTGWLRPTLQRVLHCHYGLASPKANDFTNILMDALSWDPAMRPTASHILQCSVFEMLYVEAHEKSLRLCDLWSAQKPTLHTWPHSESGLRPPIEVPVAKDIIVAACPPEWSVRSREACRPVARIEQFLKTHKKLPGFHTKMAMSQTYLCPSKSYLAYYFNFATGAIDMHDAAPCLKLADLQNSKTTLTSHPFLKGTFRAQRTFDDHLSMVNTYPTRMPFWMLNEGWEAVAEARRPDRQERARESRSRHGSRSHGRTPVARRTRSSDRKRPRERDEDNRGHSRKKPRNRRR